MDNLTKSLIKKATLDTIPDGLWKDIANEIGVSNLCTVLYYAGGISMYIPKVERILKPTRDMVIKEEFNGDNYNSIAKKYNISERAVRDIVSKK